MDEKMTGLKSVEHIPFTYPTLTILVLRLIGVFLMFLDIINLRRSSML